MNRPHPQFNYQAGISAFRAGIIATILAIVGVYFGFAKDIPFTREFRMTAVFEDSVKVRPGSPVRTAGVEVGKVIGIERDEGSEYSRVVFELREQGLPVHADAQLKVRPRIFLEGNFFLDLKPGTPSAPTVEDGHVVPIAQTANPVQIDRILTTLESKVRADLQSLLQEYGGGLNNKPTAEQDAQLHENVRGLTGAQAANRAMRYFPEGSRAGARLSDALQGSQRDDWPALLRGLRDTINGFAMSEPALSTVFTNFNQAMAAFSADEENLRETFRQFANVAIESRPTIDKLDAFLPEFNAVFREMTDGIEELPATLELAGPWFDEVAEFFDKDELQMFAHDARYAFADLASTSRSALSAFPELDDLARCFDEVVIPAQNSKIVDPPHSSDHEAYKDFWYSMVGAAGESANFDGNGAYVRVSPGGGANVYKTQPSKLRKKPLYGVSDRPLIGTRPVLPSKSPPLYDGKECHANEVPNLNSAEFKAASAGAPDAGAGVPDAGAGAPDAGAGYLGALPGKGGK